MSKTHARRRRNYLPDALRPAPQLSPGFFVIHVLHDDWCAFWQGTGKRDCNPEILCEPDEADLDPRRVGKD
jgi:hypothetical protein